VDGLGDAAASLYITTQQLFLLGGSICLLARLIQGHSTAVTQTIDGVCLRLRGGRQVAREEHARMLQPFTPSPTLPVIAQFLACPRGVR